MILIFAKQLNLKKLKMVILVFVVVDILQPPHTVISNSEKLTHPIVHCTVTYTVWWHPIYLAWKEVCYNIFDP